MKTPITGTFWLSHTDGLKAGDFFKIFEGTAEGVWLIKSVEHDRVEAERMRNIKWFDRVARWVGL